MRRLVILVLCAAVLRTLLAATLPMFAAEAYYWLWSQRLAAGYYDHPPMVALFVRFGTLLLGDSALGLRLGSLVGQTAAVFVLLAFGRRVVSERAAQLAAGVLCLGLVGFPFGMVATPDAPLLLTWSLSLLAFERAVACNTTGRWLLAGALTGACILSKYTGFGLLAGYGVWFVSTPRGRSLLAGPRPWLALLTTLLVLWPNVAWNLAHGAPTLATPFRSFVQDPLLVLIGRGLYQFTSVFVSGMVLVTPTGFLAWVAASRALLRSVPPATDLERLCLCTSWVPFGIFLACSTRLGIGTHWLAPCFLSALPLAAAWLTDGGRPRPGWIRTGVITALLSLLPLAVIPPLMARTTWLLPDDPESVAAELTFELCSQEPLRTRLRAELDQRPEPLLLMASDYHLTSLMAWLLGGAVPTLPLKRDHFRQLTHWYQEGQYDGWNALYVKRADDVDSLPRLQRVFARATELPSEVVSLDGQVVARWQLYYCEGFSGPIAPASPQDQGR